MRRSLIAGATATAALALAGAASAQIYTAPRVAPPAVTYTVVVPPTSIAPELHPSLQPPRIDELRPSAPANINCIPSNVPSTGSMAPQMPNEPCH